MFRRNVKLAFVEQDDARREELSRSLGDDGVQPDQLLGGSLEDVVDQLLDLYARHAILLFVDPFGLAVSRSTLERILRRRTAQQPIDVLYHFSLSTVARMGRAGVTSGAGSRHSAEQLDAALGPVGWRDEFEGATSANAPTEAAVRIARQFGQSVRASTGVHSTSVPVRQRPGQLPKYLLMLFSANQQAHWDFADLASSAYVDWLYHCDREDYEANVRLRDEHGLLELFSSPEPNRDDTDKRLRLEAAEYLPDYLRDVMQRAGALRPIDSIEVVYGEMLGRARVTHLRAAIKQLHAAGVVDDDGRGDFWERVITWTGG
jgi:three-Cys-motif partner protein